MDKGNEEYISHSEKLGIRYLGDEQLVNSFPNYRQFMKFVDSIIQGENSFDQFLLEYRYNPQVNLCYDNIISILGGRGMGKSSLIHTLRYRFEKKYNNINNVILPIVHPEIIDTKDTIMGWIISYFEEVVFQLEKTIKKLEMDEGYGFRECNRLNNTKETDVRKAYEKLKFAYFSRYTNLDKKIYNYEESTDLYADRSQDTANLVRLCTEFWNEVILALRNTSESDSKDRADPFIVIFIDDLDLVPEKSVELMTTIPKFLSHPRIIVIVTASPKTFLISTKYRYIQKFSVGKKFEALEEMDNRIICRLNEQLTDKVFPPAYRYYLRSNHTLQEKADFRYYQKKNQGTSRFPRVEDFFSEHLLNFYDKLNEKRKDRELLNGKLEAFLIARKGDVNAGNFAKIYLSFIGKSPREISNTCNAFREVIENLLDLTYMRDDSSDSLDKVTLDHVFSITEKFFLTVLDANRDFKMIVRGTKLYYRRADETDLFVDYNYIEKLYQHQVEGDKSKDAVIRIRCIFLQIFILMSFLEHLILVAVPGRDYLHGCSILLRLLQDWDHDEMLVQKNHFIDGSLDVEANDVPQILKSITGLYEHYDKEVLFGFDLYNHNHIDGVVKAYNPILENYQILKNIDKDTFDKEKVSKFLIENVEWAETFLKLLYFRIGNGWRFKLLKPEDFILKLGEYEDPELVILKEKIESIVREMIFGNKYDFKRIDENEGIKIEEDYKGIIKNLIDKYEKLSLEIAIACFNSFDDKKYKKDLNFKLFYDDLKNEFSENKKNSVFEIKIEKLNQLLKSYKNKTKNSIDIDEYCKILLKNFKIKKNDDYEKYSKSLEKVGKKFLAYIKVIVNKRSKQRNRFNYADGYESATEFYETICEIVKSKNRSNDEMQFVALYNRVISSYKNNLFAYLFSGEKDEYIVR